MREKEGEENKVNIFTHNFCDISLFLFHQVPFQNLSSLSLVFVFHCRIKKKKKKPHQNFTEKFHLLFFS